MTDDAQLLRQYAEGSEAAFAELVSRYVNLVYSAALRQTGNAQHAQDVAQTVFTALARKARSLPRGVILGGWLYRHTCFVAAQWMRTERRRQARERLAVAMDELHDRTEPDWQRLAPVLDDAMKKLGDADRDAIVLRYFEKRELQSVGTALGISDEAARKRIARALDKLRVQLARRGITSTSAALALALAGNAVSAAPAGIAATLTSASLASAAAGTGTSLTLLKLITMTKLQTAIVGGIIVAGVATPLMIQHQAQAKLHASAEALQRQVDRTAQLQSENERLSNLVAQAGNPPSLSNDQLDELLRLRGEVARLRSDSRELARLKASGADHAANPSDAAASELLARINFLRQRFDQNPAEKIPELQYLTDDDWLRTGIGIRLNAPDEKVMEDQVEWGLSSLRSHAKQSVAGWIGRALRAYTDANGGRLPADPLELKPYFESPVDDATLQRYRMTKTGTVDGLQPNDMVIAERSPVNNGRDTLFEIGLNGYQYQGIGSSAGEHGAGTWGTNVLRRIPLQQ